MPARAIQITLDQFCATRKIDRVDILKIDVEGFETAVLRGALGMLERGEIKLVYAECEFNRNESEPHGDFFEMCEILLPLGYRVVSLYSGGVDGNGWVWGDVLFMRPGGPRPVYCSPFSPH